MDGNIRLCATVAAFVKYYILLFGCERVYNFKRVLMYLNVGTATVFTIWKYGFINYVLYLRIIKVMV